MNGVTLKKKRGKRNSWKFETRQDDVENSELSNSTRLPPGDAYLKINWAPLAFICVFHRELTFSTYKIDWMHFKTLPKMEEVELLTEREHLDMIEGAVRWECVNSREYVDNKYRPDCDSSHFSTFVFCVDANNLYGGVMQNEKLFQSDFTLKSDITLADILNSPNDNPVGYFGEVDLIYPASLNDYHQDFPLVKYCWGWLAQWLPSKFARES